ncbi:MAG: GspH/FimT family pseudopilin [Pseudomonadota bacterium]
MQNQKHLRGVAGFSLLQLIITIAVAAALATMAIPSFASLLSRTQVSTQTNLLAESLMLARSHAIASQKNVHICRLNSNRKNQCTVSLSYLNDWSAGWMVFADENTNHNFDNADRVLQVVEPGHEVSIVFNQRGRLRFFPDGRARSAGFYLCDEQREAYRHVLLLHTGRVRIHESLTPIQKQNCAKLNS